MIPVLYLGPARHQDDEWQAHQDEQVDWIRAEHTGVAVLGQHSAPDWRYVAKVDRVGCGRQGPPADDRGYCHETNLESPPQHVHENDGPYDGIGDHKVV